MCFPLDTWCLPAGLVSMTPRVLSAISSSLPGLLATRPTLSLQSRSLPLAPGMCNSWPHPSQKGLGYLSPSWLNGIGLSSRAYSNGVTVDSSPPISLEMPVIRTEWVGSRSNHTQLSSSSLRVEWNFTDNSAMWYYYLALQSDVGKFIPVPPQITFLRLWETFLRLTLSDGDTYRVLVRGCDVGGACSSATSEPVLVDSTPPIDGYFVVQGLNSNLSVQSWSNQPATSTAGITVAFFGFLDPHSWVERYWGRVGSLGGAAEAREGRFDVLRLGYR